MANRFINPRPQFLDDAGDPIVNGTLTFFENGTTTPKDTFPDANLNETKNENPLPLFASGRTPNVFYNGTARVILTNVGTGQIWDVSSVGDSGSGDALDDWNSITEYALGSLVVASDGSNYRSLQNNNVGNDPLTSPTFWERVEFLRTWNANVTYAILDTAKGSDGNIYKSRVSSNLNNDPISSPTEWNAAVSASSGTFTAALVPQTSGTITLTLATLAFSKLGDDVTIKGLLSVDSVSSPVGDLDLTGLPFTAATGADNLIGTYVWADQLNGTVANLQAATEPGTTSMRIDAFDGSDAVAASGFIQATTLLAFDFSYKAV